MRHVTISMDDELLRNVELAAADAGVSLSEYISDYLLPDHAPDREASLQRQALERFLAGPKLRISEDGRMPTADERNAR